MSGNNQPPIKKTVVDKEKLKDKEETTQKPTSGNNQPPIKKT